MKSCLFLYLLFIIYTGGLIDAKPKKQKGICFARYSPIRGCRTMKVIKNSRKSTLVQCCKNGGLGWSLTSNNRTNCISCNTVEVSKPKKQKGVCFEKYYRQSRCRKYTLVNGEKKSTIEDCCRSGGSGWALTKKKRKSCISCDTVDTSFWGEWGKWTECSATCGQAFRKRKRKCNSKGKPTCRGRNEHSKRCKNLLPCPVDGGWTEWSAWGPCSVTCKTGTKIRQRECANPRPQHGGKECKGQFEDWDQCELQAKCPIDGSWGEWGPWSTCSKTCDLGTKTRSRKCDNPSPKYGGKPCTAKDAMGKDYCMVERCNPGKSPCDDRREECASGSGSKWDKSSGSGSGDEISGSGFNSGFGSASGEGLDGGSG